jgi:hypothetical protein
MGSIDAASEGDIEKNSASKRDKSSLRKWPPLWGTYSLVSTWFLILGILRLDFITVFILFFLL